MSFAPDIERKGFGWDELNYHRIMIAVQILGECQGAGDEILTGTDFIIMKAELKELAERMRNKHFEKMQATYQRIETPS